MNYILWSCIPHSGRRGEVGGVKGGEKKWTGDEVGGEKFEVSEREKREETGGSELGEENKMERKYNL